MISFMYLKKAFLKQDCDSKRQEKTLKDLQDRYLVEESIENNHKVFGQHNLIRSVALKCNKQLKEELKSKYNLN